MVDQSRPQSLRYPCPAERENEDLWERPISSPEFSGSAVGGSPGRPLGTRQKYECFDWLSVKQSLGGSWSYRKSSKKDIYFHWLWLISGSQVKFLEAAWPSG